MQVDEYIFNTNYFLWIYSKEIGFQRNKGFQILMRMKVSFQNKSLQIANPIYY